jgi:hypothetical protein
MFTRTLAISFLALGLLSPVVASAQPSFTCDNKDQADYRDCNSDGTTSGAAALSAPTSDFSAIANDPDRRIDEKNDNSGSSQN